MSDKFLKFIDSYGRIKKFPKTNEALQGLRRRSNKAVYPEIVETLQRVQNRFSEDDVLVSAENIALELNISIGTTIGTFMHMCKRGIVAPADKTDLKNPRYAKIIESGGSIYKLIKGITERDFCYEDEKVYEKV